MFTVKVYANKTGMEIGEFQYPRIPVKGDVLDIPTHGLYEVVRVTLYSPGLYETNPPILLVKPTDFTFDLLD